MKHPTLLAAAITTCIITCGCGTHEVRRASNNALAGRGAEYYLPRTVLVTTVPVIKTVKSPGRFHFFSEVLLEREPVVKNWSTSFRTGDELAIETVGVKDPNQRFVSIHPKAPFKTFKQSYKWNSEGVLTHGEATVEDKTVEVAVTTVEAAAKVANAVITLADARKEMKIVIHPFSKDLVNYLRDVDPEVEKWLNEASVSIGIRTLMARNPSAEWTKISEMKADPEKSSPEEKQFVAAVNDWKEIENRRGPVYREIFFATTSAKRIDSLSEVAGRAADAAALAKIEKSISDELAQFVGAKKELTWLGQFRKDLPDGEHRRTVDLFSVTDGSALAWKEQPEILPTTEFSAPSVKVPLDEPWQRALAKHIASVARGREANEKPNSTLVQVSWDSTSPQSASAWKGLEEHPGKRGWHYRIPADSSVTVSVNGTAKLKRRLQVAQHGCVAFLPASAGSQTVTSNIDLDPATGALTGVAYGGTAFDPKLVGRVGDAAAEVITAEKKAEKARAAANDPIAKLERRKAYLQLKSDIDKLEGN